MKYSERAGDKSFDKFDKLKEEIAALTDECESKSVRFAIICGAYQKSGGISKLKQNIKSLKKIRGILINYLKEINKLTARYK